MGSLADLGGCISQTRRWCSCKGGGRRGFKRPPALHLLPPHMLNGSIAASQILLLLLFSSGPWEFNLAPGEPGPTPASLLSVYQPYQCRIRNFTIYPLLSRARCRAVSTILFILAAVVAEGWLVSNGSHFPAGHSHTCLHCSDSSH